MLKSRLKSGNSQESIKQVDPAARAATAKPRAKTAKSTKPQLKLVENKVAEPAKPKRTSAKSAAKPAAEATAKRTAATPKKPRTAATPKAQNSAAPVKQIPDLALPSVSLTAESFVVNRPAFVPSVAATPPAEPLEPYWLHSPSAPLPRSASLAIYRKPGLFGLIGSWLRNTVTSLTGDDRRRSHWAGQRKAAKRQPALGAMHELTALRDENERLRRQIEALTAKQG